MYIEDLLPLLMFAALVLLLFSGLPVAAVIGGVGLAFGFVGYLFGVFAPIEFFNIPVRIWGTAAENPVLVAVPMFIFMGTMLEQSGVAEDLLRTLGIVLRRVRGGLAMAVTLMGTILAAATGIIGASVVMMTLLALPTMQAAGYSNRLSTGTIAAAGTLGILIPPSIMLVIMGDLLQLSVGDLFFAAFFPGFLLSSLYLLYILVVTRLNPAIAPLPPADGGPGTPWAYLGMLAKSLFPPAFLVFLVLGSMFFGWATPTEAAAVGAAGATLLCVLNGRFSPGLLHSVCRSATLTTAMVFFVIIGATTFSYVFRSLGGDHVVSDLIQDLGLGPWGILLLIMAIVFLLGFFFDWLEITLIVLPVAYPIVRMLDLGEHVARPELVLWFAILVAINFQNSFLTPPFGFALFYLKGTAGNRVRIEEVYRGIVPFVLLQLIGLLLVIAFPDIALWLPRAMQQ
ncbi:MAG: TRAP transporter large permease subunit [Geminicoccaceae bacterium]|nr:TRAP transporter large permease subunit [Geminicoccaceae bacterium]